MADARVTIANGAPTQRFRAEENSSTKACTYSTYPAGSWANLHLLKVMPALTFGTCQWKTTPFLACRLQRARPHGYMLVARSGKTFSRSKFMDMQASCILKGSEEA